MTVFSIVERLSPTLELVHWASGVGSRVCHVELDKRKGGAGGVRRSSAESLNEVRINVRSDSNDSKRFDDEGLVWV